jgi:flagellar biosynthesis anti-sigma factor FlgM
MRIADAYSKLAPQAAGAGRTTNAAKVGDRSTVASRRGAESQDGVKVTVSAEARELAARAQNGVDHAKVERLRSAVEGGTYKVDAGAIAARMVNGG